MLPKSVREGDWEHVPVVVRRAWERCCQQRHWPLVVLGDKGVGKSVFAALAYCDWSLGSAHFLTAATAASMLKTAETQGIELPDVQYRMTDQALLRRWCELAGLLVLDDLTNGLTFSTATKALWRIINERADRPMIVTANGSPETIAEVLGESLADRLAQGTVLLWPGESKRPPAGRVLVVE